MLQRLIDGIWYILSTLLSWMLDALIWIYTSIIDACVTAVQFAALQAFQAIPAIPNYDVSVLSEFTSKANHFLPLFESFSLLVVYLSIRMTVFGIRIMLKLTPFVGAD